MRPHGDPWRPITLLSSVLIGVTALFFVVFAVRIAPSFAKLFADFGGPLPLVSALVIRPSAPAAAIVLLVAGTAAGVFRPRERALIFSLTAGGGIALAMAFVAALYVPLFALDSV